MMNSAPAVVGASDGLAAFSRSSRKGGPALAWARGAALRGVAALPHAIVPIVHHGLEQLVLIRSIDVTVRPKFRDREI